MLPTPLACPSCNCPICSDHSRMPAEKFDPSAAAIGLFFHLQDQAHIPKEGIKKLGEYLIKICSGSGAPSCDEGGAPKKRKLPSVRDVIIDYFATLLETDSASLVKSGGLDRSFSQTLGGELGMAELGAELNSDQITTISRAMFGSSVTEAILHDYGHRGSNEIGFQVIYKIYQGQGQNFTIREFLDKLDKGNSA